MYTKTKQKKNINSQNKVLFSSKTLLASLAMENVEKATMDCSINRKIEQIKNALLKYILAKNKRKILHIFKCF
jgi:hypothetical protein